jgi:hypothetical protein
MSLYKEVVEKIKRDRDTKEQGGYVGIPLPFAKLANYYPVIEKGHAIGVLAGTGVGKSRFSRFLAIYHCFKFYKETGYKLRIFYFPLEDNKEKVYLNIICHYLWEKHGIKITVQELGSKGDRALPDFVIEKLDEAEEYFRDFEKVVTIIDGYTEPKEIYGVLEKYALATGKVRQYEVEIEGGGREKQKIYESNTHTVVLLDNMANIDKGDEHQSERAAMVDMSKVYIRERLCNFFKFTVFMLLQNDFQTERQQFGANGKAIMAKVEPSLASIGEAKTVARNMHIIFTLFDPSRFEFLRYPQVGEQHADKAYDIDILGNRFRALRIIKNNDGDVGVRVGLLFDGISETFDELPMPDSIEMKGIYERLKEKGKFTKSKVEIRYVDSEQEEAPPF